MGGCLNSQCTGAGLTQLEAISTPPRLMPDGRLLMTPYGNHTGDSRGYKHAAVLESRDQGRTWSILAEVKSKRTSEKGQPTILLEPDLVRLDDRLLMLCRPAMVWTESLDGGRTWSEPQELGISGDCPYLLMTSRGVLLCGIRHRPTKNTCVIYSLDQGKTWTGPIAIDNVLGAYPSMVELPDGRVLTVYYTEGKGSDIRCVYLKADGDGVAVLP
ncbi:MAG: exo-alpha-sialidase [Planctomycetaceae bacterium]|nr:exo-alpha-sialidase [Planctomycetaceae bacterium]